MSQILKWSYLIYFIVTLHKATDTIMAQDNHHLYKYLIQYQIDKLA